MGLWTLIMKKRPVLSYWVCHHPQIRRDCSAFTEYKGMEVGYLFSDFFGSVEILFSCDSILFIDYLEGDPLSPPEGEAAQGVHPLDPPFLEGFNRADIF